MKNYLICGSVLAAILFAPGCAFRESASDRQEASARKMDGRLLGVTLAWDGHEKPIMLGADTFARTSGMWVHDQIVTLPVLAPEVVLLTVQIARDPQDVKEWSARAVATTGDDLNERTLDAQILETTPAEVGTRLKIKLVGANTLFRPDQEQRMYLTLKLQGPNSAEGGALRLAISSPPSRLTVLKDQQTLDRDFRDVDPKLRVLFSQAETRTMVRYVRLRNDSFETIRLNLPFKNHATVKLHGVNYSTIATPHPYFATYEQKSEELVWDIESDFFVFPLSEDLPKTWTSFSQTMLDSLILPRGATIELGIYAPGPVISHFGSHPASNSTVSALASSGIAHCNPNPRVWIPGDQGWFDLFDGTHPGSPWHFPADTIALMKQAAGAMRACVDSGWNVDQCNQAALIDDELDHRKMTHPDNGRPWMVFYGCPSYVLCPNDPAHACATQNGWSWTAVNRDFQNGIQTTPATLEWKEGQVPIFARFFPAGDLAEGEARNLTLSPSGTQVRD